MNKRKGYGASQHLRFRAAEKRGGNEKHDDQLNRSEGTLAFFMDRYLQWLLVHNRTPGGVDSCYRGLMPFIRWAEERGLFFPGEITRKIIESYQRWIYHYRKANGKPLGSSSQRHRTSSVKLFFSWLCKQRILEANPASEIELPKAEKRILIEPLSIKEVESILSLPDITDPLGIRDRAILEMFYSTAARRAEMARLKISDLHLDTNIVYIRKGKGRKDRIVPIGTRALHWVEKYLNEVRPLLLLKAAEPALFITCYGSAFSLEVLGRQVTRYIKKIVPGRIGGCHLFRHSCATHMLEGGADIRYIQQLLGHENLDTTALYTRVSIKRLQLIHAHTHPAEKSKKKSSFSF